MVRPQRPGISVIGIAFAVGLASGFVPSARAVSNELAAAKRLLNTAKGNPPSADLCRKGLQILSEVERTSGDLDRLKSAKVSRNDPRYRGISRALEDQRARLNDLEIQVGQLQSAADKSDEHKKNAQDHNKTIKDAIGKMLEQIAEINRATNL